MLHLLQQTLIDEDVSEWCKRLLARVYTRDERFKHMI